MDSRATRPQRLVILATLLLGAPSLGPIAGCSGNDTAEPAPDGYCASLKSVPKFGDLQRGILPTCLTCHSSALNGEVARHEAPATVNFDTYEGLAVVKDEASYLVSEHLMPYPAGQGPTDSQRDELYAWAKCGAPR